MNITCTKCRSSIPETAIVCPVCGHDFMPAPPQQAPTAGAASPFGAPAFSAPVAAPGTTTQGGESDAVIAMVCAAVGLFCAPLALPGLYFGLRARARAAERGGSTTLGTLAVVASVIACVVWVFALIFYQRLFFPPRAAQ